MIIQLSIKNIMRNKRRMILTELSIIFGCFVIVFSGAFLKGMQHDWALDYIKKSTSAIQLEHKDYQDKHKIDPFETTLRDSADIIDRLEKTPHIVSASGILKFSGIISTGEKTRISKGAGINTDMYTTLPNKKYMLEQGRIFDENKFEAIIGTKIAEELDIKIGDTIMLLIQTQYGSLNINEYIVVGLTQGDRFEIPLKNAQNLLHNKDTISQILIRVDKFDNIFKAMTLIERDILAEKPYIIAKDYKSLIPDYEAASGEFNAISIVIGFILFLMVAFGISNTMFMAAMERRKEIGTMIAVGAEKSLIRRLFISEGIMIGLIGSITGIALSLIVIFIVNLIGGIPLPPPPGYEKGVIIQLLLNWDSFIAAFIISLIMSTLASFMPASISSKLLPAETLREQ